MSRVRPPDDCAACPRVYVLEAAGFAYKGEILRDLDRPALAGEQRLGFSRPQRFRTDAGGRVTFEIREEEPETSYIDAVALELDGRRIAPSACAGASADYCEVDGRSAVLRRGEVLRLEFAVDRLDADAQVSLWASGYYLPE